MNKKGAVIDMIVWIAVAVVVLFIFAGFIYLFSQIGDKLDDVGVITVGEGTINVTNISGSTFGEVNKVLPTWLHIIAFIIIMGGAISIFISNFLIKGNPVFFIVYVFMTLAAIITAAYISNEYMDMLGNAVIGSTLSGFGAANFIMQWLPYFTAVIGIFGAVFLFIGILKEREQGIAI
jgi:hypothetical protein